MSKVKIEGNASGTGTLTIAAPNTNTDRTLTLPDGAGELLTTTGNGSQLTGVGKVLQVVQATSESRTVISTNHTGAEVNPSVTITPSSASSKILIVHTAGGMTYSNGGCSIGFALKRGSTFVWQVGRYGYHSFGDWEAIPFHLHYLDSPNTTSAVTYTPHMYAENNVGELRHNDDDVDVYSGVSVAVTIAMEIAG
jgi:hypothetical protein